MPSPFSNFGKAGALSALIALPTLAIPESEDTATEIAVLGEGIPEFLLEPSEEEVRPEGAVPSMFRDDAFLDDSHANQELGINVYTAPSISKIFDQLDGLPSIPDDYVLRNRPEQLPTIVGKLSLELGFLLADGFIAVRSGRMNDIKPIALDLSRYGKALGVGEKMNTHSASLLEQAEKGLQRQFKETLTSTQLDVNEELRSLRDPDLSHLIALGGWVRALTASCAALEASFSSEKALPIFYPDAPEYFAEVLQGLNPQTAVSIDADSMLVELLKLEKIMQSTQPTLEEMKQLRAAAERLSSLCVGESYAF